MNKRLLISLTLALAFGAVGLPAYATPTYVLSDLTGSPSLTLAPGSSTTLSSSSSTCSNYGAGSGCSNFTITDNNSSALNLASGLSLNTTYYYVWFETGVPAGPSISSSDVSDWMSITISNASPSGFTASVDFCSDDDVTGSTSCITSGTNPGSPLFNYPTLSALTSYTSEASSPSISQDLWAAGDASYGVSLQATSNTESVPEPSSIVLALIGLTLLVVGSGYFGRPRRLRRAGGMQV